MKVSIISIGDELLIGQTINTNASWLGAELSKRGADISRIHTISDQENEIIQTLDCTLKRADIVIITGGLGPTQDDITKNVLTKYFQDELVIHHETLERVRNFFTQRNLPFLDVNIQQAMIPKNCIVLNNLEGTAPGMWFEKDGKIIISLPGVPHEMKTIMLQEVLPRIEKIISPIKYYSKTANLQGIGESYIAEKMKIWEQSIRENNLELAYLPSTGLVRLRISSKKGNEDVERIENFFHELQQALPNNFYGVGDETLAQIVGKLLIKNKCTVGTAESCTAGDLAAEFVSIPNASTYFKGGIISYSNELKQQLLHVNKNNLETYGAVSEQVVTEMAVNGRNILSVDYCIATSGIAGPTGNTTSKPIGTTWIAIASKDKVITKKFVFEQNRQRNIRRTVLSALNMIRLILVGS